MDKFVYILIFKNYFIEELIHFMFMNEPTYTNSYATAFCLACIQWTFIHTGEKE